MQHYKNISELIQDKDNYPRAGLTFIEKSKLNDLKNANYWLVSSQEEKELVYFEDERGSRIPKILKENDVKMFLDIQTFEDIINNKLEHNPDLTLDNIPVFIEAIEYYLENDDFLD